MTRFALVDCNNFYASCERVFDPTLARKPIVVLSNNDGCVIARSNEAKQLDIAMGEPFYRIQRLCQQHDIQIFSSNFSLYGDMSQRVMASLESFCPNLEIYSIDEAFLQLDRLPEQNLMGFGCNVKAKIQQWTGIPVSIGIGPTKTLAKVASHIAKKKTNTGVFDISHNESQRHWLARLPVEDVWGIGRRWSKALKKLGINTALELKMADPNWLRKRFNVVMERTHRELNGIACSNLEIAAPRKNILTSRSFGEAQTKHECIAEALANHATRACEKLRAQNSRTNGLCVFLRTNPFREQDKQYHNNMTFKFDLATNDTREIIYHAKQCLSQIFKQGYAYQRTGIMLLDLVPNTLMQSSLFRKTAPRHPNSQKLMQTLDSINQRWGRNKLFFAAQGIKRNWRKRKNHCSPRYTTQWRELPTVS